MSGTIYHKDNLEVLQLLEKKSVSLIYIDIPFNSGKVQSKTAIKTIKDKNGDRKGYKGNMYSTEIVSKKSYVDKFDNFIGFIRDRVELAYDLLKDNGSLFLHIDYREVHYCKIMLDQIFNRDCFINQITWAYDYGARSTKRWSTKHDNILWYCKNPKDYIFNYEAIDRIPYMAPNLVGPEKAARGKTPTDCWMDIGDFWWNTIVSPNSKTKTNYPTEKPIKIIKRIINVHSNKGDLILDFFAGSGTTGQAAYELERNFILVDNNIEAIEVMQKRFQNYNNIKFI